MPFCHSCRGIVWSMLAGPLSILLYAFLLLSYKSPVLLLGLHSYYFGLSQPIPLLIGFLGPFLPSWAFSVHFLSWAFLVHSNSASPWAFTNSFRLPSSITISLTFRVYGLSINFLLTYFITLGFLWLILAFHNTHGFTTSFSELL